MSRSLGLPSLDGADVAGPTPPGSSIHVRPHSPIAREPRDATAGRFTPSGPPPLRRRDRPPLHASLVITTPPYGIGARHICPPGNGSVTQDARARRASRSRTSTLPTALRVTVPIKSLAHCHGGERHGDVSIAPQACPMAISCRASGSRHRLNHTILRAWEFNAQRVLHTAQIPPDHGYSGPILAHQCPYPTRAPQSMRRSRR
jgi:hypothetical protein